GRQRPSVRRPIQGCARGDFAWHTRVCNFQSSIRFGRFWRVVALQPSTEPVESRKQRAFGDVCLIQFVAHFPLQLSRYYHPTAQGRMFLEPVIKPRRGVRHEREQRELIQDACVERWRLQEKNEWLARERVKRLERLELRQHVNRECFRLFL